MYLRGYKLAKQPKKKTRKDKIAESKKAKEKDKKKGK